MPIGICQNCEIYANISARRRLCYQCMMAAGGPQSIAERNEGIADRAEQLSIRWMGMSDTHRLFLEFSSGDRQALVGAEPLSDRGVWIDGFKIFYSGRYFNIRRHRDSRKWFCSCARRFASNSDDPCEHLRSLDLTPSHDPTNTRLIVELREQVAPNVVSVDRRRTQTRAGRTWTGFDNSSEAWAERDRSFAANTGENRPINTEARTRAADLDPIRSQLPEAPSQGWGTYVQSADEFSVSWMGPSRGPNPTSYVITDSSGNSRLKEHDGFAWTFRRSVVASDNWRVQVFRVYSKNAAGLSTEYATIRIENPNVRRRPGAFTDASMTVVTTVYSTGSIGTEYEVHFDHPDHRTNTQYLVVDHMGRTLGTGTTSPITIRNRSIPQVNGQYQVAIYAINSFGRSDRTNLRIQYRNRDSQSDGIREYVRGQNPLNMLVGDSVTEIRFNEPDKPKVQKFGGKRTFASDDEEV